MSIISLNFNNFNEENRYVRYFIELNEQTYIFIVRWSTYCNCAFLSISDYNNNPIIDGVALVNGLKIRNSKLPYVMFFVHLTGEKYEPTLETISKEFALVYDDESEVS
jgi:hypothetical protein